MKCAKVAAYFSFLKPGYASRDQIVAVAATHIARFNYETTPAQQVGVRIADLHSLKRVAQTEQEYSYQVVVQLRTTVNVGSRL